MLLNLGATLNVNDNRNVVGQTTGSTIAFGYKLDLHSSWIRDRHEVRSSLDLAQGLARTARLPVVVKSQDLLRFDTVYLHRLLDWTGPFVRLGGDGPLLPGYDERTEPTAYSIEDRTGAIRSRVTAHLPLTTMGRPFNFKESAGAFVRAVRSEQVNVETRLGLAGRQTLADGQLALRDDPATPNVEVFELESYQQVGPEITASLWGKLKDGTIRYRVGVDAMVPVHHTFYTVDEGSDTLRLTNVEAFASVSVKVVEWASIDYDLRVVRQPQLVEETQVRNNLLVTFGIRRATRTKLASDNNPLDVEHQRPTAVVPQRERVPVPDGAP